MSASAMNSFTGSPGPAGYRRLGPPGANIDARPGLPFSKRFLTAVALVASFLAKRFAPFMAFSVFQSFAVSSIMFHKVLFRMLESTRAKKRGRPKGVDPIEKIKAIMNDRRAPLPVQLKAAIALLDHENGKRAIDGEPRLADGGERGLTALLLSDRRENARSRPPSETPPAGNLKPAIAAEAASEPAASEPEAPPAKAPQEAVIDEARRTLIRARASA